MKPAEIVTFDVIQQGDVCVCITRDPRAPVARAAMAKNGRMKNVTLTSPPDADLEEILRELREHWNEWYPTTEERFKANTPRDPVEVRRQRKDAGHCLECGDAGEWVQGALMCRNGHGKICG